MKYIIFGGFDYAVYYEMDQNAIFNTVDYFVDNDEKLMGTTYLGKEIKHPSVLLNENKEDILILIGSVIYHSEIAFQLKDMGFEEDKHFMWGLNFLGGNNNLPLWRRNEWKDNENAKINTETSEFFGSLMKILVRFIDFEKYDTVIDFGAANERLRPLLHENIRYIPVDYIKYSKATVVCDINKEPFPHSKMLDYNPKTTVAIASGFIGCCKDWKGFLKNLSGNCNAVIVRERYVPNVTREYRKSSLSRNSMLFDYDVILQMQKNDFFIVNATDFRLQDLIYVFEKKV